MNSRTRSFFRGMRSAFTLMPPVHHSRLVDAMAKHKKTDGEILREDYLAIAQDFKLAYDQTTGEINHCVR